MRSVPVRRKRRKAAKRARYNRAEDRRMNAKFAKQWPTSRFVWWAEPRPPLEEVPLVPRPIVQDMIQLIWGNDE